MQTTHCHKILAFMEGQMERAFINNNFPYITVISVPNGSGWDVDRICKFLMTTYKTRNLNPDLILVWFDREDHTTPFSEYKGKILTALEQGGANPQKVRIYIPNKMTENVILADEALVREEFNDPAYQYDSEGKNGKAILSQLFAIKGINYKEIGEGTRLMKKMSLKRASTNNPELQSFISDIPFPCWWLDNE